MANLNPAAVLSCLLLQSWVSSCSAVQRTTRTQKLPTALVSCKRTRRAFAADLFGDLGKTLHQRRPSLPVTAQVTIIASG